MITNENYFQICERIKKIRKEKGLTQAECTHLLEQKSSYMSKIEKGISVLTAPTLIKLTKILDCTADSILFGNQIGDQKSLSEREEQLLNNYRRLPEQFKTSLLIYSDFCCYEAEWYSEEESCE